MTGEVRGRNRADCIQITWERISIYMYLNNNDKISKLNLNRNLAAFL